MVEDDRNRSPELNNFGNLLFSLDSQQRALVRSLEKLYRKKIQSSFGVTFNKTCLDEYLLPKYTEIRTYHPGIRYEDCTIRFRQDVVARNLQKSTEDLEALNQEIPVLEQRVKDSIRDNGKIEAIFRKLDEIKSGSFEETSQKTMRKLNKLYNGVVYLQQDIAPYVNLSNYELNADQKELLSLGPKFHYKKKPDPLVKKVEMEVLYESILRLADKDFVTVNENLQPQLLAESTRIRDFSFSQVITKKLREAGKSLKEHDEIIIRKADKSNCFVVIDRAEYKQKLDTILSDHTKFTPLQRNPTSDLKTEMNKLIKSANEQSKQTLFKPIVGEYKPGYLYGTVKIHKPGNPLRPIISQIPTPIYETAKTLNNLIAPYLPARYQINSTDEFIQLLRVSNTEGKFVSIDVESLFTNVPLEETIEIICHNVYNHPSMLPPLMNAPTLRKMLIACTSQCPFLHMDGKVYVQNNGVAMGSPLGVTFANYYMTNLENTLFDNEPSLKPAIYCRYIDDCFLIVNSDTELNKLVDEFHRRSCLNFTTELGQNRKINFLDVSINGETGNVTTTVFRKPTSSGLYLNARSECPERYKESTIKALIHRTYKICSEGNVEQSINVLKQAFINNGYSNTLFDAILHKYKSERGMDHNRLNSQTPPPNNVPRTRTQTNASQNAEGATSETLAESSITHEEEGTVSRESEEDTQRIYYRNQYSNAYKTDERILKQIIRNNVQCINPNHKLKLIIYYKSSLTTSLVMKNDQSPPTSDLQKTNLVYEYICDIGDCERLQNSYIGVTRTTLSRRLTMHKGNGAPKDHCNKEHNQALSRDMLVTNTKILRIENDPNRLTIFEALLIHLRKPTMNNQATGMSRTLKLYSSRRPEVRTPANSTSPRRPQTNE